MKNLIIKLLVVVVAITLTTNLSAENRFANTKESANELPTIIFKFYVINSAINCRVDQINPLDLEILSYEEKDIFINTEDDNPNHTASAVVMLKTLDGTTELGPYTVTEGTVLELVIDEREWIVIIEESTEGAITTYWY